MLVKASKKFIILYLLISVSFLVAPIDGATQKKEQMGMHFQNVSLLDFIEFVSEYTGVNIIYDPGTIKGTVTIKAKKTFSKEDLLEILNQVLKMNNLESTRHDGILYIVNKRNLLKFSPPYQKESELKHSMLAIAVFQVENVDAKSLSNFINILKSDIGRYVVIPNINTVIVKDKGENLKSIAKIIKELTEMGKGVQIRIFPLKYSQATEFIRSLKEFFTGLKKLNFTKGIPVFMADRFSNSVIVAAMPDDMSLISRIISRVDVVKDVATRPRVFRLKYAKAEDVEKILNKILKDLQSQPAKGKPGTKPVITVAADKATNTISVVGDPEVYARVESLIKKLDIPRDQIFVEALIIETTLEQGAKFGVEWIAGAGNKNAAGAATFLSSGNAVNFQSPVLEGSSPNFGALPEGFSLGILGNIITYEGVKFPTLTALVNAIKSKSGINILSKPQILTLDNEEAEVFVGENRPFLISEKFDSNNNPIQTFDYRDVGIKLKILPHVVDDDTILLTIKQEVKKVIATASGVSSAPITLTRSTNTTVKLKNNMTVVISGLIKNDSSVTEKRVPILSDIPILGWLFRSKSKTSEKTNMMVFITTRIIRTRDSMERLTREKKEAVNYTESNSTPESSKTEKNADQAEQNTDEATDEPEYRFVPAENQEEFENPFFRNEAEERTGISLLPEELDSEEPLQTDSESSNAERPSEIAYGYPAEVPETAYKETQNQFSPLGTASEQQPSESANTMAKKTDETELYSIQAGFFRSLHNATELSRDLKERGYDTTVLRDSEKDGYRVLIGKFSSLKDALQMKELLKSKEGLDTLIYYYH